MIAPDAPLNVTLQAQQWNVVLAALAEAPWRIADPVIRKITEQTQSAVDAATAPALKPNGADHDATAAA